MKSNFDVIKRVITSSTLLSREFAGKNRIQNYKRIQARQVEFEFEIACETALEEVRRIPAVARKIVEASSQEVRFKHACFKSYGENALLFEIVYYVLAPDYNKYLDLQQEINRALLERLRELSIVIVYSLRTESLLRTSNRLPLTMGSLSGPGVIRPPKT